LNITEESLNNVLTNITLSAITLGTWWDMVNVTTTSYRSTYKFSNPLNLILPYSICMVIGTAFAAAAIWSLYRNGVPAADGGFLQIMMTTRGDTQMNRLVLREGLNPKTGLPDDLKHLKVRYGELGHEITGGESGLLGFGTTQEVVSPMKRS
jgi:hypothetical protein